MVPPAFTKVGQLMFKRVFDDFKHDADHCTEPPVT